MGSEFFINSQELENKIRQLLPSQGGGGAGFDLSASTQIIPIIDLTESAEGSNVRPDLQTALSHGSANQFSVANAAPTIITNTGYWRITASSTIASTSATNNTNFIGINDGSTTKIVWRHIQPSNPTTTSTTNNVDITVFLTAGDSLIISSDNNDAIFAGSIRQVANIDGILVNP